MKRISTITYTEGKLFEIEVWAKKFNTLGYLKYF